MQHLYLTCLDLGKNIIDPISCYLYFRDMVTLGEAKCSDPNANKKCPKVRSGFPASFGVGLIAPEQCGYKWPGFDHEGFVATVEQFKNEDKLECKESMCTSAAFLAWVAHIRHLRAMGKVTESQYQKWTEVNGKAHRFINHTAEPNELVEAFGIGKGYLQYIDEDELGSDGVPRPGDLVQIWRKSGNGHSVVFKGFIDKDKDGQPDLMCYWSSQPSTKGYGNNCETVEDMDRILIGSFND